MGKLLYGIYKTLLWIILKMRFGSSKKSIVIFDLDNTLYNTWPYINKYQKKQELYGKIPIFETMKSNVFEANKEAIIVFLTARKIKTLQATKKRLEKDFKGMKYYLVMVDKSIEKLAYLKFFLKRANKVMYFDDLSFNQENGKEKFYNRVIEKVKELPLTYYGAEHIKKINRL